MDDRDNKNMSMLQATVAAASLRDTAAVASLLAQTHPSTMLQMTQTAPIHEWCLARRHPRQPKHQKSAKDLRSTYAEELQQRRAPPSLPLRRQHRMYRRQLRAAPSPTPTSHMMFPLQWSPQHYPYKRPPPKVQYRSAPTTPGTLPPLRLRRLPTYRRRLHLLLRKCSGHRRPLTTKKWWGVVARCCLHTPNGRWRRHRGVGVGEVVPAMPHQHDGAMRAGNGLLRATRSQHQQ